MSKAFDRFQALLRELFQFDSADLDFGIYRILNARRDLFEHWIEQELPKAVNQALQSGALREADDRAERLEELSARLREEYEDETVIDGDGRLREDIKGKTAREYRGLWQALQADGQPNSADSRAADIYNRLYDFFRRYYQDGDFLSLRRYGADNAYAVPYNGQEVMLHWANKDQYYIKTGEHFADYRFRAGDSNDAWHVEFRLHQVETDRDNTKSADKRYFFFDHGNIETDTATRTLVVPVAWRAAGAAEAAKLPTRNQQDALNEEAERKLLRKQAVTKQAPLLAALKAEVGSEDKPQTLLARHLRRYTRRNTSDFFIHKDLRGFLTGELDYWLKAEVLKLDTLLAGGERPAQAWLQTLGCLRSVAMRIIEFLARIEDFQKKLYEKRKFITACHWCVTLDHVERAGLTDQLVKILNTTDGGKAQKNEWKRLFAIDEVKAEGGKPGWKNKVTPEFLRSQPYLVLDTVHMPRDFTDALLASFDHIDAATDGVLVHGDNWQALNLLMERYREQVQCVYIDPPYNTGSDNVFLYKDDYQHSSWMSMMFQTSLASRHFAANRSGIFVSTDDGEYANVRGVLDATWGSNNFIADIIWNSRKSVSNDALISIATNHTTFFSTNKPVLESDKSRFRLLQEAHGFENPDDDTRGSWKLDPMDAPNVRENLSYAIINPSTGREHFPPKGRCWRFEETDTKRLLQEGRILFGRTGDARPMYKRYLSEAKEKGRTPTTLWDDVKTTTDATKLLLAAFGDSVPKDVIDKIKPKPIELTDRCIELLSDRDGGAVILDYFAGSGTTAHAVIRRQQSGISKLKFLCIEVGSHFDAIQRPRLKKFSYSLDWKDGKPVSRKGSSHVVKYIRLESYEDALSNLRLRDDAPGQGGLALDAMPDFYRLGYWLDVETAGSASLLDVQALERPFDYALTVHDGKAARTQPVDLPETFNYLIGLIVQRRRVLDRDGRRYLLYTGRQRGNDALTAVLWRDIAGWDEAEFKAERDWIKAQAPFGDAAVIFVNGDCAIPDAQSLDPVFHARMFAPVN